MKKFLLALMISAALVFMLNMLVYKEVPETFRKEQLSEIQRYKLPINSIDMGESDHADLKVLDSVLIGNRILMLGESTHHDGETFKAKSRLIQYLHENHGYHVVLYEAGQFDVWIMNKAMNSLESDFPDDSIGGLGLFNFWWANEETQPLIDYYQQTKKSSTPIELGGFDIQFSGSLLTARRTDLLKTFLAEHHINLENYPLFNENVEGLRLLTYKGNVDRKLNTKQKTEFLKEIKELENAVRELGPSEENMIYARYLNDIASNLDRSWKYETGSMESMNLRDSLMARNLIYQLDSVYGNQKIIVWCSNIHTFSSPYNEHYFPMGAYIKQKYGEASYMLNFSSYGRYKSDNKVVDKPGKLAIENIFHNTRSPYFLINLKDVPANSFLQRNFVSTINQGIDQERVWSKFIDGIFYIDINRNPTYPEK